MSAVHETTSARRVTPGLAPRRGPFLAPLLALAVCACASGRSESSGGASGSGSVPAFVRTDGPCWVGGRITLDPSLRAQSTADELASIGCDNVVLVMKTDDGSTKLVHADGVLAGGWGECHYQVTDVPPGGATFSGKVVALSIPDYRYSLISKADFNAVKCGGSLASLNQQLDFVLTVADVRGR
ncbi:MAG: hypothetical protein EHM78_17470 [Myxococcaceae bacterium]|nr:MAG: hypothetical protein EHM78_17470 [Myxococcaceae bacterium]